jgi:hypothetical protein
MRQIDWVPTEAPKAKKSMGGAIPTVLYILMLVAFTFVSHNIHEYNSAHHISNCIHYLDDTSSDCAEGE